MAAQKGKERTPGVKSVKGENFYRDAKTAKRMKLLSKDGIASRAIRDRSGNVVRAAEFQSSEAKPGRVQPDRRWFNNTRVIGQDALDHFRTALGAKVNDPYSVVLRRNKLPMSLIQESRGGKGPSLTEVEPFEKTFGPGAQRKRPRLEMGMSSFADLAKTSEDMGAKEDEKVAALEAKAQGDGLVPADREIPLGSSSNDRIAHPDELYSLPVQRGRSEPVYSKGQSRRIWGELYKVIDSSDVILHVLDARDPLGTRCRNVEKHIREETPHKHLVFILNKVDLVPTWVTVRIFPLPHCQHHIQVKGCSRSLDHIVAHTLLRMWKRNGYRCTDFTVACHPFQVLARHWGPDVGRTSL
jgi:nucleolar GTP-binding protein 2